MGFDMLLDWPELTKTSWNIKRAYCRLAGSESEPLVHSVHVSQHHQGRAGGITRLVYADDAADSDSPISDSCRTLLQRHRGW